MAQKVITTVSDDFDGAPDATEFAFGYGGKSYLIDLAGKNAEKFAQFFDKHVTAARVDKGTRPQRGRPAGSKNTVAATESKRTKEETADAREWAKQNGYGVSDRGRLSAEVWAAYDAAPPAQA